MSLKDLTCAELLLDSIRSCPDDWSYEDLFVRNIWSGKRWCNGKLDISIICNSNYKLILPWATKEEISSIDSALHNLVEHKEKVKQESEKEQMKAKLLKGLMQ